MKTKKRQNINQKSGPKLSPWLLVIPVALIALIAAFFLLQPGGSPDTAQKLPAEISVAEAAQKRDAGAFILDVREPDEWNQVHIPDATLIPLGQLESRLSEVPKDQEVVVVCRSGNRSATGRDILAKAGFEQVTSMAGGMNDWQSKGFPTTTGP